MNKKIKYILVFVAVCLLGLFVMWRLVHNKVMDLPFLYYGGAGGYVIATVISSSPLVLDQDSIKPIHWNTFDTHPQVQFMADPFVVRDGDTYYIFYEEIPPCYKGETANISVIASQDLQHWQRLGVVLRESFHQSFPNVARVNGKWYMIPESVKGNALYIYTTTDDQFPYGWERYHVEKSIIGADNMFLAKDSVFYVFSEAGGNPSLMLYYAYDIAGPWHVHPMSPIRVKAPDDDFYETRPASTVNVYHDTLYYGIQRHDEGYGTGVVLYRIDSISPTYYHDTRMDDLSPLIWKGDNGWNACGAHQWSYIQLNDTAYFCVVDGVMGSGQRARWRWDWRNFPPTIHPLINHGPIYKPQ